MATSEAVGFKSISVLTIDADWALVDTVSKFSCSGVLLKGITLVPGAGGANVFAIKDADENGAYLYLSSLTATAVIVYPYGIVCRPFIDYSECTLRSGHIVTFMW